MSGAATALPRAALLPLAGVTLVWGTNWAVMKVILAEVPPLTFRAVLPPLAGLILLGLARLVHRSAAVPRGWWRRLIVLGLLNMGGWNLGTAMALTYMSSGRTSVLAFTMPLWASLLATQMLGKRLDGRRLLALGLGMAGVAALLWGEFGSVAASPVGAAFILGAAMSWGLGTVLTKAWAPPLPPLSLAGWQMLIASVPLGAAALAFDLPRLAMQSTTVLMWMAYFVAVPLSFAYFAWFSAVRLAPAGAVSLGTLSIPVIAVVTGWATLGEPLGARELVAVACISGALGLVLFGRECS